MRFDPDVHSRRSIRLKGFDYASAGAYFITVCVQGRECLFGEIDSGEVALNEAGRMVENWWNTVHRHFPQVTLDEYIIMPNHFHGILWIAGAGSPRPDPTAPIQVGAGSPRPTPVNPIKGAITPENQVQTPENQVQTPQNQVQTPQNQGGETPPLRRPTLGQIVGYFKYQSTKEINCVRGTPGVSVWQRNYYERIIRDEDELHRARRYIQENPLKWEMDGENPINAR